MARSTKAVREAAATAAKAEQDARDLKTVHMPTKAQLDAEEAECRAEEAAALAQEAADLAAEAATTPKREAYNGPMLALRDRLKLGAYRKAANGQPACGDDIAKLLGQLQPAFVIRACMVALALPNNPYEHLNIGQQSMNLRNKLRGALKRGDFGNGVVVEAVEDALALQQEAIESTRVDQRTDNEDGAFERE